ncbi:hypothetical protein EVAR_67048_1 [Eumeta japonica]|uniref:Uncharacterized protein n=1 Tax=Eumeta variegata TaxID=151549 RepID=A0A4C2A4E9_EUMVA|nr:hypothetical protein EVAR_67048_1 [Eumeta japonica]
MVNVSEYTYRKYLCACVSAGARARMCVLRHVLTLALVHPSNQSDIIHIHNKRNELSFPNLLELHIHANQDTRQDESNEPKLDGVASFNYGVPVATFQLHH